MIIGLTGTMASGKETVSNILKENGFTQLVFSDIIREELYLKGFDATRENMLKMGNELRKNHGDGILAKRLLLAIKPGDNVVVDGIRTPGEVKELSNASDFVLVAVDCPQELRFKRLTIRNREGDAKTFADFKRQDDFENKQKRLYGQRIEDTIKMARRVIYNTGTIDDLRHKVGELLKDLGFSEKKSKRPSWDTYFMQLAELVSTRSSCIRRQVGAVIVKDKMIVSTGYNGTPRGLLNCNEGGCKRCNSDVPSGTSLDSCYCVHAEENAIVQAAYQGISTKDAILYTNFCPCSYCAKSIVNAGIRKVIYRKDYALDDHTISIFKGAGLSFEKM